MKQIPFPLFGSGTQTQGFVHIREALYQWAISPAQSPFQRLKQWIHWGNSEVYVHSLKANAFLT